MVQSRGRKLVYGNIKKMVSKDISTRKLVTYLMGKTPHWTDHIFETIEWDAIMKHLKTQQPTRFTTILKMVHRWQHDGHQNGLFYGIGDGCECIAGCREMETRYHYI